MKNTQKKNTQRLATLSELLFLAGRKAGREHKPSGQVAYLVQEILAVCQDAQSERFYTKVARLLPDTVVFQFLAEIRQDPSIANKGAVFVAKVREYLERHV